MRYWFVRSPFKTRKWEDVLMAGIFNFYGIRSNASKKNISKMEKGDLALWYSSSAGKKVYGQMQIKGKAFPDKTTAKDWLAIDFIPESTFKMPVSFENIKESKVLSDSYIINQKRILPYPYSIV